MGSNTCCQETCAEPATVRVFWPGKPPLPMCSDHAKGARMISAAMGVYLHTEPLGHPRHDQ
jgi:hypothetical protein